MSQDIQKAFEKDGFYRDHRRYLQLIQVLLGVLGVGIGLLIYVLVSLQNPAPLYFPSSASQQILSENKLEEPGIETNVLLNWVAEAMMKAYTFNFVNYPTSIQNMRPYFTAEGFDSYQSALAHNQIIAKILKDRLVLKAVPTDAPHVLLEKPFAGRYMWKVKAPMRFSFRSMGAERSQQIDVTLIVMRVPSTQSPNGVSILKVDMEGEGIS